MPAIRNEASGDHGAIRSVEQAAFDRDSEADLVDRLRADGDLVLSLIASEGGAIVGHLALSHMTAPFRALGLGPVAVVPIHRNSGIGGKLIERGIAWALANAWQAIFVLGEPAYYGRFGFNANAAKGFASPYAGPYLMVLPLSGPLPVSSGPIDYAPAFAALP